MGGAELVVTLGGARAFLLGFFHALVQLFGDAAPEGFLVGSVKQVLAGVVGAFQGQDVRQDLREGVLYSWLCSYHVGFCTQMTTYTTVRGGLDSSSGNRNGFPTREERPRTVRE